MRAFGRHDTTGPRVAVLLDGVLQRALAMMHDRVDGHDDVLPFLRAIRPPRRKLHAFASILQHRDFARRPRS